METTHSNLGDTLRVIRMFYSTVFYGPSSLYLKSAGLLTPNRTPLYV